MSVQYTNYLNAIAPLIISYPIQITTPIGIIGNLFSFFIYTRPNLNKNTNTGFLYALLSLLDLIFILYFAFVFQSSVAFNYTVTLPCGVLTYLLRITFCFAPWMQVVISFDRFVAVVYPLKKHVITTKLNLTIIMLCILAMLAVANMPNLLSYPNSKGSCVTSGDATAAANIITIFLRAYVPFAIILIMDLIVFSRMKKSKRRVGVVQMGQRKNPGELSNREYNFMISTILIDMTFLIFYTPIAAHVTITVVNIYVPWGRAGAYFNLYYYCALLAVFLYSVLPFFMFFILNRYFRNEVLTLLRLNRIFPSLMSQNNMDNTASTLTRNNNNKH